MEVKNTKLATFFLGILTLIAVGTVLHLAQTVIIPLVIAWLISQLLGPAVVFFVNHKAPPLLAILLVMILLVTGLYYVGVFIAASATQFVATLPGFQPKFTLITNDIIDAISPHIGDSDVDIRSTVRSQIADIFRTMVVFMTNIANIMAQFGARLLMILIMVSFMLMGKPYSDAKIKRALSPDMAKRAQQIIVSISTNISQYLFIQFIISLITGLLVWFVCEAMSIEAAITWGALAFFLNFIPMIGSIIACIPPVLLALLQGYPHYWPAVILTVILVTIQQVLGNVVSPKMMGDRLNLSPVVILLSLLFWGWLWGVIGALLSVMIAASIKIVCDNIEGLRPVGIFMEGGRASARALQSQKKKIRRAT